MPGCEFITQVDKVSYGGLGCDKVEFLISPNKGEDVKPLSKIASGGELSRIMLAIKCIMAKSDEATTYIFDEIDTGVSGLAAQKVALKLNLVGKSKQTLVITHSAHIAAAADHHFLLYKNVENGRTKTHISHLDFDGRVNEIARINSGSNITETSRNQAKELLEKYM
jgi:DNA repair protein RecN (Recombination protein N)